MVEMASAKFVCIVDESKLVSAPRDCLFVGRGVVGVAV